MMKLETWLKLNASKLVITGFNTAYEWSLTWTIIYSVHVHICMIILPSQPYTRNHCRLLDVLGTGRLYLHIHCRFALMLAWETMKVLRNGIQVVMITYIQITHSTYIIIIIPMRFTIVFISRKFRMTFSAHRLDLMKEVTQSNRKYAHNYKRIGAKSHITMHSYRTLSLSHSMDWKRVCGFSMAYFMFICT